MEDIFKDVAKKEQTKEEIYTQIVELKKHGLGWKRISSKLQKPTSTLRSIYNRKTLIIEEGCEEGCESVPIKEKATQCDAVQPLTIEYIESNYVHIRELEKLKQSIEEVVNKRLNYGLKQIKEELKNGKKA